MMKRLDEMTRTLWSVAAGDFAIVDAVTGECFATHPVTVSKE